jgi:hypothetical protein
MTLGIFMPLFVALTALVMVPLMLRQLRALPGPTDPDYDEAQVSARARGLRMIIAAELATPVLLWIALNVFTDAGTLVLL